MPKETFFRLRDEKQEGIMRSAIHEFVEHGFERAKISDIAKNAGVATGSIYQYFEDKKELFMYCAQWGVEVFMKKIDAGADIRSMDIFEYYNERVVKTQVLSEERELSLFMQELSRHPDLMYPSMREMYKNSEDYIKILIQNGQKNGVVRDDIPYELIKEFYIAVTERFKLRWMQKDIDFSMAAMDNEEMKKEVEYLMELLKKGMGR